MARRQNYGFQKRQKETRKQKKKDEKTEKKRARREAADEATSTERAAGIDEDSVPP